ncbi:exo-alpha-sialidase [Microbacterium sp. A588]
MHYRPRSSRRRSLARVCTAGAVALALVFPVSAAHAAAAPGYLTDPTSAPGSYSEQNIGSDRTEDNFFYRIPALAHLGDGVILASWDARPGSAADSPNPNSIIQRRSTDNGQTWSDLQIIAAGQTTAPRHGYSDPSYVVDHETGRVFAFFVYSKDQGFWGSVYGNDDANRQVMSAAVIQSDDQGLTWSEPRLISDVVKTSNGTTSNGVYSPVAGDVRGAFASSGEGIQLKYGEHAGRLIQQYAGEIRQANGSTLIQAYSVYSDDHGATWQRGEYTGSAMDENKVVELSDGSVMLNSRDNARGTQRKVAISTDGGVTYGAVTRDAELPDPTNNASITRLHPDAAQGSADAKKLLFTNSNSTTARANGGVRLSCDDGETWPGLRTIETGTFGYSTATAIGDGRIGVLWEAGYTNTMQFSSFDEAWLNAVCAPLSVPQATLEPGVATAVPVTVTNQEAEPLSGTASFFVGTGWTASDALIDNLAPGASVTVDVDLTAPAGASNTQKLQAAFTASDGRVSQTTATMVLPRESILGATLSLTNTSAARDIIADPYRAGDVLSFRTRVVSTSNEATIVTPAESAFTSGFAPTACRWKNLPAYDAYNCNTPTRTLTQEDIDRGWFTPSFSFTVAPVDGSVAAVTVSHEGAPVLLRDGVLDATITGDRTDTDRDLATDPYAVGEQVPYSFRVDSTSPVTAAVVPTAGAFSPFLPAGAGNCRYRALPAGDGYTCSTPRHTVTQQDIDRGYFAGDTTWSVQAAGQSNQEITVAAGEVDVIARNPHLTVTVKGVWDDADGNGFAAEGDTVTWTRTLTNDGNVALDAVTADGVALGAIAAGASIAVDPVTVTLTAADVQAQTAAPAVLEVAAANGAKAAVIDTKVAPVALPTASA